MAKNVITEQERPTQVLRDVVISRVEPSLVSEHPKSLYPSVYDMMALDMYVPSLVLYRLDSTDPSAFTKFIHAVKKSLSQLLSLYYPMAGKWIVAEDAWIRELVCTDEGAVFVEAAVDDEMDNVVNRDDYNPPEELTGEHAVPGFEASSVYKTPKGKEYPALIVQVTRFICGGVALALTYNHMTVDGYGFDRLLKAWSEILSTGHTSAKPGFDRSMVASHLDKMHLLGISLDMENRNDVLSSNFRFSQSHVQHNDISKYFSIRKVAVESLRQKAEEVLEHVSDIPERPPRFTTFECVCAQLWRCFARIPTVLGAMSGEDMVRILFPVEGRRKWSNPPLPEDYVGNITVGTFPPVLPRPEVTDRALSFAASHIHESVVKVNHKTSGELLDGLLRMIKEARSTEESLETEKPEKHKRIFEVTISSWSRFDNFYNLDFGYGAPYFFSPCPHTATSGLTVILLPPRLKSRQFNAVELFIRGPLEYISILLEDPEFICLVS